MSTKLNKVSARAKRCPRATFCSLTHILTPEFLKETWSGLNRRGCPGVDRVSISRYQSNLDSNIQNLVSRLKSCKYRAPLIRRAEIPKSDGRSRPLGIPTVEDRLLQRAVARILMAIYEEDFCENSFGFRANRNAHQALKQLRDNIIRHKVRYVFEADIKAYFDKVNHRWLMKMLEHRIQDRTILRLIGKWLRAGVLINGVVCTRTEGCPQGGPLSPVLANIYLHYVLDLWFEKKIKVKSLKGESYLTRFADDFVICFQNEFDMNRFARLLELRLETFSLTLSAEKTKGFTFGRFAKQDLERRGKKVESFDFLGFTHVCGKSRQGKFDVIRIPSKSSCRKFCDRTFSWLRKHQHWRTIDQQKQLKAMLLGFYQYFSLCNCQKKLSLVRFQVMRQWRRVLSRRSQRGPYKYWSFLKTKDWFELPQPILIHKQI